MAAATGVFMCVCVNGVFLLFGLYFSVLSAIFGVCVCARLCVAVAIAVAVVVLLLMMVVVVVVACACFVVCFGL